MLQVINKLQEELLVKIDEKAKNQSAVIGAPVVQVRKLYVAIEVVKTDNLTLEASNKNHSQLFHTDQI